ncbi:MAG: agmatine deiminase family protein [bacterium]
MLKFLIISLVILSGVFLPLTAQTTPSELIVEGRWVNPPSHDPGIPSEIYNKNMPAVEYQDATVPPQPPVRMCAEWEPAVSVLIRYPLGLPWDLVEDLAQDVHVTCLVSSSNYSSAQSQFNSHGISPSQVDFVITNTNTYWTRDYGPWFVFDGQDTIGISDHVYNRVDTHGRIYDDQSNWYLAPALGVELWKTDLRHTGGNFMCDGHGVGMSSDDVYNYSFNSTITQDSVNNLMNAYWGIHTYHAFPDPLGSYIDHIDCYAKFLNEEKIVVITNGVDDYNLNQVANQISGLTGCFGEDYQVVRLHCPDNHDAAYVNCLIVNSFVYLPLTGYYDEDTAAIHFYERELPGYTVKGYQDYSFEPTDAIHCRTKAIYDPGMLYVDVNPHVDTTDLKVKALVHDYNGMGVKTDSVFLVWRFAGDSLFTNFELMDQISGFPDSFQAYLPLPVSEETLSVDYYVFAADNSGRHATDPYTAPGGYYNIDYEVMGIEEGTEHIVPPERIAIYQQNNKLVFTSSAGLQNIEEISIMDITGRIRSEINRHLIPAGGNIIILDLDRLDLTSGIYLITVKTDQNNYTDKINIIR